MSIFDPRNNTSKWAAVVMPSSKGEVPVKVLEEATEIYVKQHIRILDESIHLFLTSRNKETRQSRYRLACEHYGALSKVKKYCTKEKKKLIDEKINFFVKADDIYRHPDRAKALAERQKKKDDFWEGYALSEMIEIFSEDWNKGK